MVPAMTTNRPLLGRTGMTQVALLLGSIAVVAAVVAVAAPLYRLAQSGGYVEVHRGDVQAGVAEHLADGVRAVSSGEMVTLAVDELPTGLRVLTELSTSLTALAVAVGAWLLARVISSIQDGRPFDRHNARRLAAVAAAVVLGGTVAPMLDGFVNDLVVQAVEPVAPGSPLTAVVFEFRMAPLFVAVLLLAGAEAFRRGRELADDVAGLV